MRSHEMDFDQSQASILSVSLKQNTRSWSSRCTPAAQLIHSIPLSISLNLPLSHHHSLWPSLSKCFSIFISLFLSLYTCLSLRLCLGSLKKDPLTHGLTLSRKALSGRCEMERRCRNRVNIYKLVIYSCRFTSQIDPVHPGKGQVSQSTKVREN